MAANTTTKNLGSEGFDILRCDFYPRGSDTPIDFRHNFLNCSIEENMFADGITGKFRFVDNMALRSHLPMTGGEALIFSWRGRHQDEYQTFYGRIKSYSNRIQGSQKVEQFQANVVSDLRWCNSNFSLNTTIRKERSDEALKAIFQKTYKNGLLDFRESKDIFMVDECKSPIHVVPTFWSPWKTMKYITERCQNSKDGTCDYMLWERCDGLAFSSIQTLIEKNENIPAYIYSETPISPNNYNHIQSWALIDDSDILKMIECGGFSHRIISVDSDSRNFMENDLNYNEWFGSRSSLGNYSYNKNTPEFDHENLTGNPFKKQWVIPTKKSLFFDQKPFSYFGLFNTLKSRVPLFNGLNLTGAYVQIYGDSNRRAGDIIEVGLPTPEEHTSPETAIDRRYSGKWLCTVVRHHISSVGQIGYRTEFQIFKDGIETKVPDSWSLAQDSG